MAPIVSGNLVTNTAPLIADAQNRETGILQMENVIQNEPINTKRAEEQPRRSVFNMNKAVILSDTVDERLAKAFLVQARDPTFDGQWDAHIQRQALRLIRLRLHDVTYRSLVPSNAIHIWPKKYLLAGNTEAYSMIEIAETIMKLYQRLLRRPSQSINVVEKPLSHIE